MIAIEEDLKEFPLLSLVTGELLLTQGGKTDCIYFMVQGSVKIVKDDYEVATVSDEGAVFGELSILLEKEHSASVECL
jgi:CRP/FNR family transcriptional regulator, cyclic AMP receptor protein